jgi:hypothetical protein
MQFDCYLPRLKSDSVGFIDLPDDSGVGPRRIQAVGSLPERVDSIDG